VKEYEQSAFGTDWIGVGSKSKEIEQSLVDDRNSRPAVNGGPQRRHPDRNERHGCDQPDQDKLMAQIDGGASDLIPVHAGLPSRTFELALVKR
jgi:hypothetical protein